MEVEVKIVPDIAAPKVVIYAPKITPVLMTCIEFLESAGGNPSLLVAKKDDKMFVIEPEQVEIVRTEGSDLKLYNRDALEYIIPKTLHETHDLLGAGFVRISKSAIVNMSRVDHLSPSFNGTMYIVMKNGVSDYISRKYLGDFKKRLGL
jgi:DNA-binding LytR/AlgR family response regulator